MGEPLWVQRACGQSWPGRRGAPAWKSFLPALTSSKHIQLRRTKHAAREQYVVEFPSVYRPCLYNKPTAHLEEPFFRCCLMTVRVDATFVYTPTPSAGEKPCEDLCFNCGLFSLLPTIQLLPYCFSMETARTRYLWNHH